MRLTVNRGRTRCPECGAPPGGPVLLVGKATFSPATDRGAHPYAAVMEWEMSQPMELAYECANGHIWRFHEKENDGRTGD